MAGMTAAALVAGACGSGEGSPGGPPRADLALGPEIRAADATATLPMEREGYFLRPVAAVGDRVLIEVSRGEQDPGAAPQRFALWDVPTGATDTAWEGEAGRQEIVTAVEGATVVTVRTGFELPFADWEIVVRDLGTGAARTIAASDPAAATAPGVEPVLPLGLAPSPSLAGGKVTWAEYRLAPDGAARRAVRLFDLHSGAAETVAEVHAGRGQTLDSPSLGGGRLAWIAGDGSRQELMVRDLAGGAGRTVPADGRPFMAALSRDGRYLAWDDRMTAKYTLDLETGATLRYATDEGWGVLESGGRFSWAPAAAYGGRGGYFDAATGTLRLLEPRPGVTNLAQAMGPWFVWQEIPRTEGGPADTSAGVYRFARIGER